MSQPIFVVLGATGAQGGSVIDAILRFNQAHPDKAFKVRGMARKTDGAPADALRAKGVELVAGNMKSSEDLKKAFAGASNLFAVTQAWDKETAGSEFDIGKLIADEAKSAGISYVWWSELPNSEKISNGKFKVHHFTNKAKVGDYMRASGLKTIAVAPAFYFSNWLHAFAPSKADDGALEWKVPFIPQTYITAYDVAETGAIVEATLENPEKWVGQFIPLVGTHKPAQEYVDDIARVGGFKTRLVTIPREIYSNFFPGAAEIADMCGWFEEFQYYGPGADLESGKTITGGKISSWDNYLAKNIDAFRAKVE